MYPTLHKTFCNVIARLETCEGVFTRKQINALIRSVSTCIKEKRVSKYRYMWFVKSAQYMNFIGIQSCNYVVHVLPPPTRLFHYTTANNTSSSGVSKHNSAAKDACSLFYQCSLRFHLSDLHVCLISFYAISFRSI